MIEDALPRAIFWDMDGTLVDSEPLWGTATYELSERLGRRITPELREKTVGNSFAGTLGILAQWAGVEPDYATERRWMYDRMGQLLLGQLEPLPGVVSLLEDLKQLKIPMMVTTNTERELADPSIDAVGREFFVDSISGDEIAHPKPAPDMYLEAARRMNLPPSQCLVFEDSHTGISAAVAAGCRVIGINPQPPAGAVSLYELHGSLTFSGATSHNLKQWWASLVNREEL